MHLLLFGKLSRDLFLLFSEQQERIKRSGRGGLGEDKWSERYKSTRNMQVQSMPRAEEYASRYLL